ncbi:hypothetical protein [Serratia ficaria]|uniref:hypothetical protein n=1 Tax=Serratia ficaria TaxID=61651 RepID=UPI0021C6B31E|nr:hypothetical protein [Serratia ficaria]
MAIYPRSCVCTFEMPVICRNVSGAAAADKSAISGALSRLAALSPERVLQLSGQLLAVLEIGVCYGLVKRFSGVGWPDAAARK